jgi:hypothetical protein
MNYFLLILLMAFHLNSATATVHYIDEEPQLPADPKGLYIDLIKRAVANTIYEDGSFGGAFSAELREIGRDHPLVGHTMIGMRRLDNIQLCLEDVIQNQIPGDCIETGVWRGGATILMAAILKAYGETDRRVWVADSFAGVPPPNAEKYPHDLNLCLHATPYLAVSMETVQKNFKKYNLLDNQVVFLKGWFKDTLPEAPVDKIALLRLDGDLYESTMDSLTALYPKLSIGGYAIIDDYNAIGACRAAVTDYRESHGITDPIIRIDNDGVYWKKSH